MRLRINWDGLGISTSVVCAVHCAVLPLLLPGLSLFGVNIIHNPVFEWTMIGIAISVGIYALAHGYKKHHQQILPILIFSLGAVFLVSKQFSVYESAFLFAAVVLIITAHVMNYKLCTRNKCHSPHHSHG